MGIFFVHNISRSFLRKSLRWIILQQTGLETFLKRLYNGFKPCSFETFQRTVFEFVLGAARVMDMTESFFFFFVGNGEALSERAQTTCKT